MIKGGLTYLMGFGRLALYCLGMPGGSQKVLGSAWNDLCK